MRILITFSSPVAKLEETILEYKDIYKDCIISVLASEKVLNRVKDIHNVDNIISFKSRFFNLIPFLFNGIAKVRKEKFDELIILYNNPSGGGYFAWELMAFISAAKQITSINPSHEVKKLKLLPWLKKRCFFLDTFKFVDAFVAIFIFLCWFIAVSLKKAIIRNANKA